MLLPTARLIALVALGAVVLLPALHAPGLAVLLAGYNGLLAALCLAEALASVPPRRLTVTRRCPTILSLGSAVGVTLEVRHEGPGTVTLTFRETVPEGLAATAPPPLRLTAGQTGTTLYRLTPLRRGRYEYGPLCARWPGPLGLLQWQTARLLPTTVKVYPNLRSLTGAALHRQADRRLAAGLRAARLRGAGTEFESLRDYQRDDEYRRIHWGASARRGKPVSRRYEPERSQTVLLALDAGRLMTTRLGDLSRLDHALNAALLLADIALRQQDKVGLLVFAEEPLIYLPPSGGRAALGRLLEAVFDLEGRLVEPDYGAAGRLLGLRQRKRALVALFTEPVDPRSSEALLEATAALRPAHLPLCVALRDPELSELARRSPETAADVFARVQARRVLADRAAALDRLRAAGVRLVDADPADVPARLIQQYTAAKVKLLL